MVVLHSLKNLSNMACLTFLIVIQIAIVGLQTFGGQYSAPMEAELPVRFSGFFGGCVAAFELLTLDGWAWSLQVR